MQAWMEGRKQLEPGLEHPGGGVLGGPMHSARRGSGGPTTLPVLTFLNPDLWLL